jgi:hypothetical protein
MKSIWTFLLTSTSCCHPSGFKNRDRLVRKCPECCFKMFQGDSRFVNRKHSEALGKSLSRLSMRCLHSRWVRSTKRALDEHRCSACGEFARSFFGWYPWRPVARCYPADSCFMIYEYLWWVISRLCLQTRLFPSVQLDIFKWCMSDMSAVQVCSPSTKTSTSPSCGMSSPRCVGCGLRGHGVQRLNVLMCWSSS